MDTQEILKLVKELGLTIESKFIPYSQSRNAAENWLSLNWDVKLLKGDWVILKTPYSAGCGHCLSKLPTDFEGIYGPRKWVLDKLRMAECEKGKEHVWIGYHNSGYVAVKRGAAVAKPNILDVLHGLVSDSSVLDSGGFENWAAEFGYDSDSRKAEQIYRTCLDNALALRASIGEEGMQKLREAFQDY